MSKLDQVFDAVNQGASKPTEYYQTFLDIELFVCLDAVSQQQRGKLHLGPDQTLQALVINVEGKRYIPVFDSLDRFQQWINQPTEHAQTSGRSFLNAFPADCMLLVNPGTKYQKIWFTDEIRYVQSVIRRQPVDDGLPLQKPYKLHSPKNIPNGLLDQMRLWLSKYPEVVAAYLALYSKETSEAAYPILVVRTVNGERDLYLTIFKEADISVQNAFSHNGIFKAFDGDTLDEDIENVGEPVYLRS